MSGRATPVACCDADCAGINHCRVGGYQCECCGLWFCGDEIDENGLCGECAEKRMNEET